MEILISFSWRGRKLHFTRSLIYSQMGQRSHSVYNANECFISLLRHNMYNYNTRCMSLYVVILILSIFFLYVYFFLINGNKHLITHWLIPSPRGWLIWSMKLCTHKTAEERERKEGWKIDCGKFQYRINWLERKWLHQAKEHPFLKWGHDFNVQYRPIIQYTQNTVVWSRIFVLLCCRKKKKNVCERIWQSILVDLQSYRVYNNKKAHPLARLVRDVDGKAVIILKQ